MLELAGWNVIVVQGSRTDGARDPYALVLNHYSGLIHIGLDGLVITDDVELFLRTRPPNHER